MDVQGSGRIYFETVMDNICIQCLKKLSAVFLIVIIDCLKGLLEGIRHTDKVLLA